MLKKSRSIGKEKIISKTLENLAFFFFFYHVFFPLQYLTFHRVMIGYHGRKNLRTSNNEAVDILQGG